METAAEKNAFNQRENRDGCANAEGQRGDHDQRKARGLPQLPEGEAQVTQEIAHWLSMVVSAP